MSLTVDPEILRAFAWQVDDASKSILDADVDTEVSSAADGLPGSSLRWATRLLGGHVHEQAESIATNIEQIGRSVRGASNSYEVTDSELAGSFAGVF